MPMNPRIAERGAFGRPDTDAHDDVHDDLVRHTSLPTAALIGRCLLAAIFLTSGIGKLTDLPGTVSHMTQAGIPYADTLALVAGCAEILGAIALVFGFLTQAASLGLILYMIPTTLIFHAFWNYTGEARMPQMVNFMKNLSIMGGLALLFANGAGRYSIDAKIRKPIEP